MRRHRNDAPRYRIFLLGVFPASPEPSKHSREHPARVCFTQGRSSVFRLHSRSVVPRSRGLFYAGSHDDRTVRGWHE